MVGEPTCPRCEGELTGKSSLCPRCLLAAGLDGDSLSLGDGGAVGVTMALSHDPTRALADLTTSLGAVPRILLRDADSGLEPPTRPGSDAMPAPEDRGGPLQILGEIARGGMGAVLKGRDVDLGRDLAVKVLLDRHRDEPEMLRRFVEEAQITGQLQHPGIVPVYRLGAFGDRRPYFTMKLVKGRTLTEILRDRPGPSQDRPRLLAIFLQIAQAMAYAHARGVIHRDLKPSNVMVGSFGEVQVMDWGLAKVMPRGGAVEDATAGKRDGSETVIATARSEGEDADLSRAGSVLGTPAYMAPEQARGEIDHLDERCDVFALGSILCEILTGDPAFTGRNAGEIQRKAARGETSDALARLNTSGADPELLALATACLASEPEDRPRDAGTVAERLSAHLAGVQDKLRVSELDRAAERARAEEALKTAEASEARAKAERGARRLTAALAASIVGLVALGAGGYSWVRWQKAELVSRTAKSVDAALADAERAALSARNSSTNAEAGWAEAVVLAEKADELARQGSADEATRLRAASALKRLKDERSQAAKLARQAEIDRRLMAQLVEARLATMARDMGGGIADSIYKDVFKQADLDPDGKPAEAGDRLRAKPAEVAQAAATVLDAWASARRQWRKDVEGAKRLTTAARRADPDPWRCELRSIVELTDPKERRDRLKRLAEAARPDVLGPLSIDLLGRALADAADWEAAENVLIAAQRQYPGDPLINYDLGIIFFHGRKYEKAIPYLTTARAFYPQSAHLLGHCLTESGDLDDAEALYRDLTRLQPEVGTHGGCLVRVLRAKGQSREAAVALDEAVTRALRTLQRGPSREDFGYETISFLGELGRFADTESASREAIRKDPTVFLYHAFLAASLTHQRRYPEAEAAAREAIRLKPENWRSYTFLGTALRYQGRLEDAFAAYREAKRLFSRPDSLIAKEIGTLTSRAGRQVGLASRLPAVLRGEDSPKNAAEGIDLAEMCLDSDRPALAARLLAEALAAEPSRAESRVEPTYWYFQRADARNADTPRYEAARAAILAGTGRGLDAAPLDDPARARFRAQALAFLRQELAAWSKELDRGDLASANLIRRAFESWIYDFDLDVIRVPESLKALPEAERLEWQSLWDGVDEVLQKAAKIRR